MTALCLMSHLIFFHAISGPMFSNDNGIEPPSQRPPRTWARTEKSDPPALPRPAAVMRDRGHVADRANLKSDRLQRPQRAFAPRSWAADLNVQRLHAVLARFFTGVLGRDLRSVRRRFPAALEALSSIRGPRYRIALRVGDRDHRVVEGRGDMRHA